MSAYCLDGGVDCFLPPPTAAARATQQYLKLQGVLRKAAWCRILKGQQSASTRRCTVNVTWHLQQAGPGGEQCTVRPLLHAPPIHEMCVHRVRTRQKGVAAHLHGGPHILSAWLTTAMDNMCVSWSATRSYELMCLQ
jgi:hypothetical protein